MRGGALFNGKEGRGDFRKSSTKGGFPLLPYEKKTEMKGGAFFNGKPLISKAIPKLTAYPHFSYFIPGYITNTAYQAYCKQLHLSVYFTLLFNLLDKYQIKVH